ncbi:hypothetical protein OUZ56_017102 [Daphnia magna]|uniref:Uncharacterized protein n=1 Tax=Daphnia magna TaxID=35525 RepID=A0ABR0AS73_9CRUS|nr:hypothetical protein OUZ56_017102 [Daphnia magna]
MYAALTYFIEALNSEVLLFTLPQAISSLQFPTTPQQKQPSDLEDPCISLMVFPSCSHSKEATPQFCTGDLHLDGCLQLPLRGSLSGNP